MKTCPQCDTGYPDSQTACPIHGHLLNEIRELRPGMVIHKTYRIVRKLGQGGMGTVYLAQHIHMGEPRALKFLSPELSRDQALTSRFLREVRTLRQIHSRNVVDCGDLEAAEDDSLFFSMEFVDGPDLRGLMHKTTGPLPVPLALSITRQIAEGLGAAHSKVMVHRDIKPENILMARDGDSWLPKIADFGIVATKESSSVYTRTGGTLLTMAYAAPEQWRGMPASELDGRTDLYALGGLLYEMLTGQTAFHAENYEGWSRQHQTTPPQPPSTLRPELTNWQGLDALVQRLLAKDRDDRPKDVTELLGMLDAIVNMPPKKRRVTKTMKRGTITEQSVNRPATVTEQTGEQLSPPVNTSPNHRKRRFPVWVWVVSIAVLLVVALAAVRLYGPSGSTKLDNFFIIFGLPMHGIDQPVLSKRVPANAAIQIENPRGDVSIMSGADSTIEVRAHEVAYTIFDSKAKDIFDAETTRLTVNGSSVLVKSESNSSGKVNLIITVPKTAKVTVIAGSGDVTVTGLDAGITVTACGDIQLNTISGPVEAHITRGHHDFSAHGVQGDLTVDGDLNNITISEIKGRVSQSGEIFIDAHVKNVRGPLHLHTSITDVQMAELPGDLTLDLNDLRINQAKGPVRVVTHSKDIDLNQIYGDIYVETGNGNIKVEPAGSYSVEAKNNKGDVVVTLPPNISASVNASTYKGAILSDYPVSVTGGENKQAIFTIGSGASKIILSAYNGNVSIKKVQVPQP
jgi:serine/threonine protein kinase/DUF4097 and DUF4098 domain-containing protein YvlB